MSTFREYICWRDDAVLATTPRDAASLDDGHFQAIHHPLRLRRRRLDERPPGRWVTEPEIVAALRGPLRPDGYLFIPIVGGSGTGKSHLVRWVKDQTQHVDGWESRYLPKNRTGIRRAIEIVIRGLSGKKIDEAREALEAAPGHTETDEVLAERLLDELALLIAHTEELPSDPSVQLDERQVQLRRKLERQLPDVLRDPIVRRKLVGRGAVIRRLVGLTVRGRQAGDGLDDDATHFVDSDLPLTFDEIGDTSKGARTLLGQLATIPDLLRSAIGLINEALPLAEKRVSVSAVDLVEVFRDVRRTLLEEGKELVLFIEDLTVLHGVEREFLDAIVEPAKSPEGDMCNLRVIFAVTEGHFNDLDTVRTRCDDAYWLDAPYGDDGVQLAEALSFLGRYLNSSRLAPDQLERSWAERHGPSWLPNACSPCPHRDECHDTFGHSAEGYGLYPLNAAAARRFVEALSGERFDPRDVVREVVNRFLLQGAADMRQRPSCFPSNSALATFDRNTNPLPPLLSAELRSLRPTDHERVINALRYWSEDESHTSVTDATLKAFGIEPQDVNVAALRSLGGAPKPETHPVQSSARSDDSSGVETRLPVRWRAHFAELAQWQGRTQDLSARATNDLRNLVHKTVVSNLEVGPTSVHMGAEFSTRFRAEPHVGIEGTVTQQNLDAAVIVVARTETNAAALQGLILAAELGTHDYPQASHYRRAVASRVEVWTARVAEQLTKAPSPAVVASVEGLLVASAVVGLATQARGPADFLDAIFQSPPDPTANPFPRTDRWVALTARARELIPRLRTAVEAEFGESRGSRGGVRVVQADRLLPIIEAFTRSWNLESPSPAIAPLMRSVAAAVEEEWALLATRLSNVAGQVDRNRPWPDQTAKVIEVLQIAHNAGRLRDTTALAELKLLAAPETERALRSVFEASDLTAKELSLPEKLVVLAGTIPVHVALVHEFVTKAESAIRGVERDLLERQAAGDVADTESIATQVLDATTRFADLAKELAE